MAKVFKSLSQVEGFLNKAIEEAVKKACDRLLKALKEIKTYCAASLLDELDYVIKVMEKLIKDDVTEPLTTDFTKLKD